MSCDIQSMVCTIFLKQVGMERVEVNYAAGGGKSRFVIIEWLI